MIVIEASGLAEPQELIRMLLGSENPRIVYGGLVEVVDAAEFDATRERHPELDRHLALADLVVLNKTDRVDEGVEDRLRTLVQGLADGAAVVASTYGRIDPELLFDGKPKGERFGQLSFDDLDFGDGELGHGCHDGHLHGAYESLSFASVEPLHPRRLLDFLDERPEGLYRIKGFVDFGAYDPRNRYTLHAVGRFLQFYPERAPAGDGGPGTQLVLIGTDIDAEKLHARLDGCRDTVPQDDVRPEALWGILRYVQEAADRPDAPDGPERADEVAADSA